MTFCPLTEIRSPRLQEFAAYLEDKRGGGAPVDRADIDPILEIPKLAKYLLLIERIRAGAPYEGRFRIRLVGTGLAAVAGVDYTGRWLDEVGMDADLTSLFAELNVVFAASHVFSGSRVLPWETRAHVVVEWVAMHLAGRPDMDDLVIFAFDQRPDPD